MSCVLVNNIIIIWNLNSFERMAISILAMQCNVHIVNAQAGNGGNEGGQESDQHMLAAPKEEVHKHKHIIAL